MRGLTSRLSAVVLTLLLAISGCSESPPSGKELKRTFNAESDNSPVYPRWYRGDQVTTGGALFQANCATCHKADASGTENWKERDAAGKLPPPPLNGTAHTWHHSMPVLHRTIRLGGTRLGGTMPAFDGKLNSDEIDAILAWIQSHWPDSIYATWHERNNS